MDFSRSMAIISTSFTAGHAGVMRFRENSTSFSEENISSTLGHDDTPMDTNEIKNSTSEPVAVGTFFQRLQGIRFPSGYFPSFSSYDVSKKVSLLRAEFPTPLLVPQLGGTGNRGKLAEDPQLASHFSILLDDLLFRSVFPQTQNPYPGVEQTALAINIARWLTFTTFVGVAILAFVLLGSVRELIHLLVMSMVVILLQAAMTPLTVFQNENPACVPFFPATSGEWISRTLRVSLGASECCHSFIFAESSALLMVLLLFFCNLNFSSNLLLLIFGRLLVFLIAGIVAYCLLFARSNYLVDVGVGSMVGGLIFWLYYSTLSLSRLMLEMQKAGTHIYAEEGGCTKKVVKWTPLVPIDRPTALMRLVAFFDRAGSPRPSATEA
ncbi:hypothetical protein MDAP_001780 [Mitosporidium daphniae]